MEIHKEKGKKEVESIANCTKTKIPERNLEKVFIKIRLQKLLRTKLQLLRAEPACAFAEIRAPEGAEGRAL